MKNVFVCYRRNETSEIAKKISDRLSKQMGKRHVFIDVEGIRPAEDFHNTILKSIESTSVFLVLIGPDWLGAVDSKDQRRLDSPGDYVRLEIEHAMRHCSIKILPVLIGSAQMPDKDLLPPSLYYLAFKNALTLRPDNLSHLDQDLQILWETIQGHVAFSWRKVIPRLIALTMVAAMGLGLGIFVGRMMAIPSSRLSGEMDRNLLKKIDDQHYSYKWGDGSIDLFDNERYHKFPSIPLTLGRRSIDSPNPRFNNLLLGGPNPVSEKPGDLPVYFWDVLSNHRFELKYSRTDAGSSSSNMFLQGVPSIRPNGEDHNLLLPTIDKAIISTGADQGLCVESRSHFGSAADVVSVRTYYLPTNATTTATLSVEFRAEEDLFLDKSSKDDTFRFLTVSSLYKTSTDFDANVILFDDQTHGPVQIPLNDPTWMLNQPKERNDVLFFRELEEDYTKSVSWFELVNEGGSQHQPTNQESGRQPDGPSLRVDVLDSGGLKLVIRGFLYHTKDPDNRTLDVWVEWVDVPSMIPAGSQFKVAFKITASPPRKIDVGTPTAPRKPQKK